MKTTSSKALLAGRIAAVGFGLVLVVALLVLLAPKPAEADTTFTVNRTGDASDRKINGVCDSSRKRGKQCTLRAAIQEANATLEPDTINFNIRSRTSVKTISPASPLPEITEELTINGYSQPGASENTLAEGNDAVLKVQLNGTNAGAGSTVNGLTLRASGSTIKGLVINRFGGNGIDVQISGGNQNRLEGNFIGTDASGTVDLGNGNNGVRISADNNLVGGTSPEARNVISGNEDDGVEITSANENSVEGNYIGTNAGGTAALGNGRDGVAIFNGLINDVGDTVNGARNVISGNAREGVEISGSSALGNEVEGNFIGTNAAGNAALGNGDNGVAIFSANDNTIGGTGLSASNVISGNGGAGVLIEGSAETPAPGNEVLGNFIGTNFFGTAGLGNNDGVVIASGAQNNTIGGSPGGLGDLFSGGAGNVISGNRDDGVEIRDDAVGNQVLGNFVGTNPDGTGALGNTDNGVDISNADDNTIGGTVSGARNVISGNDDGVVLFGTGATGNKVEGNFIGTDKDGTGALGNSEGVLISSANGNTIGGTASGAGNRIAHNEGDGVLVGGGGGVGNSILSNSIFSNGGTSATNLGIDLGTSGVTANDTDDPDSSGSSNRLQNFPEISSAVKSNTTGLTISGTLNSNPSQSFTVQCFVAGPGPFAPELDPSGHGEGQILVGADTTVTTDANGDASFSCVTGFPVVAGQTKVTATATNTATGDTSEFSLNQTVVPGP